MVLTVHVENIIDTGSSADCDRLHQHPNKRFPTKNLGDLTHYTDCGFKYDRDNNATNVFQEAYIDRLLECFIFIKTSPLPAAPYSDASSREGLQMTKEQYW